MEKVTVRDKLWLFASRPHDDDPYFGRTHEGTIVGCDWSRITPAEGAFMLGTPNLMMIISDGIPVPYSKDAKGYLESFCRLKKVLWSCTGSAGFRLGIEEDFICDMKEKYPNLMGGFFDDFSWDPKCTEKRTPQQVKELFSNAREKFDKVSKDMEIWATCYVEELESYPVDTFDDVDVLTIWSMHNGSKERYENNFKKYEDAFPNKKKAMGIYMYDYVNRDFIDLDNFKMQCETSLKWLKEGRIDGIIFLTNCTMGIKLETEKWLRNWIDEVGEDIL